MTKAKFKIRTVHFEPKKQKSEVVYTRFEKGDLQNIDLVKRRLKIKTRSETIRFLASESAKSLLEG